MVIAEYARKSYSSYCALLFIARIAVWGVLYNSQNKDS